MKINYRNFTLEIPKLDINRKALILGFLFSLVIGLGILIHPKELGAVEEHYVEQKEIIRDFIRYTPAPGETLDNVREKFGVSAETIIWSHELDGDPRFDGSENLLIPPTSGIVYYAAAGDTWEGIAGRFGIQVMELKKWNVANSLNPGQPIIIPGAHYGVHEMTAQKSKGGLPGLNLKRIQGRSVKRGAPFVGGWCTSWVYMRGGQHLPWRGDAKHWPARSAAAGWRHSTVPSVGAIYAEPWYSPWGHVSLVVATNTDGTFIVSEMPTFGLGNPSYRIVPAVDPRAVFIYYPS